MFTNKKIDTQGLFDRNLREDYMKPGFENFSTQELDPKTAPTIDSDLDGEIYAEQLHTLLQRISPEIEHFFPRKRMQKSNNDEKRNNAAIIPQNPKLTDEEKIWNQIHGTDAQENQHKRSKAIAKPFFKHQPQYGGGVFEGAIQGPKMFSQSVVVQTVRKPDGSYETQRTIRDANGQTKTTITRSANGKTDTVTSYTGEHGAQISAPVDAGTGSNGGANDNQTFNTIIGINRNLTVSKGGYLLPNNLW